MVVCAVYFVPVAGYIPSRSAIKYLASQRDMEVWLAPIGAPACWCRTASRSRRRSGLGVMQATQFVSLPQSPRRRCRESQDAVIADAIARLASRGLDPKLSTGYPQELLIAAG